MKQRFDQWSVIELSLALSVSIALASTLDVCVGDLSFASQKSDDDTASKAGMCAGRAILSLVRSL
jgi:hypothetical protein